MGKLWMYAHGGSGNHGCEAIVRATLGCFDRLDLLKERPVLVSAVPEEDQRYGLDRLCTLVREQNPRKTASWSFVKAYAALKCRHDYVPMDKLLYRKAMDTLEKGDIALSIGGDNYCYADVDRYIMMHDLVLDRGARSVLWGCSVEPKLTEDAHIAADLRRYSLITARETISYAALKRVNPNTVLVTDPAFDLETTPCPLDPRLEAGNVIGINISPMIVDNETVSGMAYENYRRLIAHILETSDAVVALIPHVVWDFTDDRTVLRRLYEDFDCSERLVLVEDHTAPELKYIISKCRLFIGARTHATIAAYSSCVPTLVIGYSVKARGIARDLFGSEDGYVLPVQSLTDPDQMVSAFDRLDREGERIRRHLVRVLPEYKQKNDALRR